MQSFFHVLRDTILPWAEAGINERIVVARQRMQASDVPSGVKLTHRKIPGKRVIVKGRRIYGNTRLVTAEWPEARMHEMNAPRFICVVDGRVKFRAGNYELDCGSGDFILIPPGIPHSAGWGAGDVVASSIPGKPCLLLWMSLYQRGVHCWLTHYENDGLATGDAAENYLFISGHATQLFKLFVDEAIDERHGNFCNKLISAYFTVLQRELFAKRYLHAGPFVKTEMQSASNSDFLVNLTKYIQQHLHQPLRLADVAREFYTSPTQFMRQIRHESGQTFVEFLTHYRMEEAKVLLRESEWSVQIIASFVGFTSSTYFHALFQRQVGCTPNEFRLQCQKAARKKKSSKLVK